MIFILASVSYAQLPNKNSITNSGEYYYGSGISQDANEALDQALKELTSQIAVHVAHSFKQVITETGKQLTENVESILNTHSAATLRNVQKDTKPTEDGRINVFCYLKKSEVEKIFSERRQLIAEMVKKADIYADEQNLAHSLKLYYFAAILLNSLPDENVVYEGVNYTTEIPKQINQIIMSTRFKYVKDRIISDKEREITLRVCHKKAPAALVDFTFWDGANQVAVQGRDGLASFRLVGASVKFDELKLNVKTSYYESRKEYNVIETLWDLVKKPSFQSRKVVSLEKTEEEKVAKQPVQAKVALEKYSYNFDIKYEEDIPVAEKILSETNTFLEILETANADSVKSVYVSDPFLCEKVKNYIQHNNPHPVEKNILGGINKTKSGYELRRIRMLHSYPTIHKQSTEYLVLDFDEQGQLMDLNTCISNQLYHKFVQQAEWGKDWGNRQEIIKFLEKYRTAYLTRDIKTVDLMFAEDAIIIVGRKLETKKLPEGMVKYQQFGRQPSYNYLRMTKQEYLKRQRQIFKSIEDIFLDFSTFNIVRKNNQPSIYGVEMRQTYLSTTYGDEGYLFLLIDFEPDTLSNDPLIYVRAWQPNAWSREEMIRTGDFVVHK